MRTNRNLPRQGVSLMGAILVAICLIPPGPVSGQSEPNRPGEEAALGRLMDRVWDFELTEFPMLATDVGDPRGQDRLGEMGPQAIERRVSEQSRFLEELAQIDPSRLNPEARIDHELLRLRLQTRLDEHRFGTHLMPINNREGFHISFPELPRVMNPKTPAQFAHYVARLRDFTRYVDEHIELMRRGIERGLTPPAIIMRDAPLQTEAHVVDDPEQSLLLKNIAKENREALGGQAWDSTAAEIRGAIVESVIPAYQKLTRFLREEYLPACRGSIAASALPEGRAFYANQIRRFTTVALTAEELHEIGLREVTRIRGEMEKVKTEVGFDGDLPSFITYLRQDPRFYAQTPEELMKEVALILKAADGRLPELFGRLPRTPYGIREIPAYVAPQTTSAYYWPPAADGTRAGFYYVNTYNLSARPLYQLEALSLHEAVPGHHLQLALQAELEDLHPIRKQTDFTAFIEGWGLYSERLGKEIGFYTDPHQEFGRLSMEAWRACRLVVDTGMHALGWSRNQAIEFMKANTALSEHNVVAEVDRYIGWPGQALAYKVGELTISKLRREAEEELGERFDVREFHDRVLAAGSIPLPLLEERIRSWVETRGRDESRRPESSAGSTRSGPPDP